jgi:hypothetical protein
MTEIKINLNNTNKGRVLSEVIKASYSHPEWRKFSPRTKIVLDSTFFSKPSSNCCLFFNLLSLLTQPSSTVSWKGLFLIGLDMARSLLIPWLANSLALILHVILL